MKTSSFSAYSDTKPKLVVNDFNAVFISEGIDSSIGLVGNPVKGGTS